MKTHQWLFGLAMAFDEGTCSIIHRRMCSVCGRLERYKERQIPYDSEWVAMLISKDDCDENKQET